MTDSDASLKLRLGGTSVLKAGLESVDRNKVNQTIYNLSKGSAYFEHEKAKDKALNDRINSLVKQRDRLVTDDSWLLKREEVAIDKMFAEWEEHDRDLTQTIVHIDMDAFFATVHELEQPELKNKPMGVGTTGVLSTANYIARKHGVRSAMPVYIAQSLCPEIVLVPLNFSKYREYAGQVRAVLEQYDPEFYDAGLDEAYLNFTSYLERHPEQSAADAVAKMRSDIHAHTGLTASAGVAVNARLAKICSDLNKPNGQFILGRTRDAIVEHMGKLNVRRVPGVGKVTERLLNGIGIYTGNDVLANRAIVKRLFSQKLAIFLFKAALGYGSTLVHALDEGAETSSRKSVSVERTFAGLSGQKQLEEKLDEIAEKLANYGYRGKTLTLKLKKTTFQVLTRAFTGDKWLHTKADFFELAKNELLAKELAKDPNLSIRLMGLRLSSLETISEPKGQSIKDLMAKITAEPSSDEQQSDTPCPVCGKVINDGAKRNFYYLNLHLDTCLNRPSERKPAKKAKFLDNWLISEKPA